MMLCFLVIRVRLDLPFFKAGPTTLTNTDYQITLFQFLASLNNRIILRRYEFYPLSKFHTKVDKALL